MARPTTKKAVAKNAAGKKRLICVLIKISLQLVET